MDQLGEGGRSIHELDKQRRRLQVLILTNFLFIKPFILRFRLNTKHVFIGHKIKFKVEKDELQGALEEAESALEQEENRVARAQMDIAAARADIERRLHDKEEEFEATRKNFARAIDSISASLEGEAR